MVQAVAGSSPVAHPSRLWLAAGSGYVPSAPGWAALPQRQTSFGEDAEGRIYATDSAANTDPTPASRSFTVDTSPPEGYASAAQTQRHRR